MITVHEILRLKGSSDVWSVSPQSTVFDALKMLADKDIGAVVVLENDKLVGIFSERDYARKVFLQGKCSPDTLIQDVMTTGIVTISSEHKVEEVMAIMTNGHFRHLPVIEKGNLVGIISIGDVVKAIISRQEDLIASLENYISGSDYGKS
jgi:CBS domain-containing protein